MAPEEAFDLPGSLAREERADGIDEASAGLHQFGRDAEQPLLNRDYPVEPVWDQAPAPFRVAAPGAASRSRSVYEDEVGGIAPLTERVQLVRRVEQYRMDARASLFRTRSELRQARAVAV